MKKIALLIVCFLIGALVASAIHVPTATARSRYYKGFKTRYVGDKTTTAQKALAAEIKLVKGGCYVCHVPPAEGEKADRTKRNPYGQELAKLFPEPNEKDDEKILQVLGKVEKLKLKDADKSIGELLRSGKLPYKAKAAAE